MKKVRVNKRIKIDNKGNVKGKKNRILCIILKEGHGSSWLWLNDTEERFSVDNNTYFKITDGTYIRKMLRFMVYIEGISVPIHHGYVEREEVEREYVDRDTGKLKKIIINKIKGLNFDSKVIDILLNRNLADEFTKTHIDLPNLIMIILLIVNIIIGIAGIGVTFWKAG